jgi:hypothetical protein
MKQKAILFSVVSLTAFLLGCGSNSHDDPAHDHATPANTNAAGVNTNAHNGGHTSHGVEFKEGQGLTIPPITRETLGLQIVDVSEGKATRRIDLPLRVFKSEKSTNAQTVLLASAPVDTNLVAFLNPGTEVTLTSDASPLGKVLRIEAESARLTGLAEVVVQLPASRNTQVGTFLDGKVTVTTRDDVVLMPRQALLKTAEGYFAYVVNGNHLFRTKISVGGQEGDAVEVTDGLYPGDRVVLQPIMSLWLAELQAIRGGKACADGH